MSEAQLSIFHLLSMLRWMIADSENWRLLKTPFSCSHLSTTFLLVFCSISPDVVCLLIWIPENDLSDVGVSRGTFTWKTDSFMKIDSNQIKWSFGFHLDVSRMVMSSSSSSSSPPSSPFFPSLVGLQVFWLHTMHCNVSKYVYAMAHLIIVCALIHECMEAMPSIIPFQNMSVHHTCHILCVKYITFSEMLDATCISSSPLIGFLLFLGGIFTVGADCRFNCLEKNN